MFMDCQLTERRAAIARKRTWNGKPIPEEFFDPAYHSDSESAPLPDLSKMQTPISASDYKQLRNGAYYEILTPGWRNKNVSGTVYLTYGVLTQLTRSPSSSTGSRRNIVLRLATALKARGITTASPEATLPTIFLTGPLAV